MWQPGLKGDESSSVSDYPIKNKCVWIYYSHCLIWKFNVLGAPALYDSVTHCNQATSNGYVKDLGKVSWHLQWTCCKAMTHFSVTGLYLITMKPYRVERQKKWGCLSWQKWLCELNHCEVLYLDCFSLENSAKSKIISIIACIADIKQIENAAFLFNLHLQHIEFLSGYNYNLFISEEKCPSGVLPISTRGRDKISNEPFSTSTLKLPIRWQISPATDLSKFSTRVFFIILFFFFFCQF